MDNYTDRITHIAAKLKALIWASSIALIGIGLAFAVTFSALKHHTIRLTQCLSQSQYK